MPDLEKGNSPSETTRPASDHRLRGMKSRIMSAPRTTFLFFQRKITRYRFQTNVDQPSTEADCTIFRVSHRQRELKLSAYQPNVVSIGPYHRQKPHLKAMEDVKKTCEGTKSEEIIKAVQGLEKEVGKCYEKHSGRVNNVMLLLDGCFIVNLIRKKHPKGFSELGEPGKSEVWYDLLLLENQLPFFLLSKLDRMIMQQGEKDRDELACAALSSFREGLNGSHVWFVRSAGGSYSFSTSEIKHLLDLVYNCCRPSPRGTTTSQNQESEQRPHSLHMLKGSATELEDAGIDFSRVVLQDEARQSMKSLFDITFTEKTKTLEIPTLYVDHNTERLLHNFLAYEQRTKNERPTYVSDYVIFMNGLIKTKEDVQLLSGCGIIDNCSNQDKAGTVIGMFEQLCELKRSSDYYYYAEIVFMLNRHCDRKWNLRRCKRKWKKYKNKLMSDYFYSPWSICAFGAATFALLLTLLQTTYTVLSYYYHHHK